MDCKGKEWFEEWFDSAYYHMLYQHRDEHEAADFLKRLMSHLDLPTQANVLDLACGKGRHSKQLHALGYRVLGIDLSASSIALAKESQAPGLDFMVMDMRNLLVNELQDCVLNLFTSFGYFKEEAENHKVLECVSKALKPNGYFVIDYLNSGKLDGCINSAHHKTIGDIQFRWSKRIESGKIIKTIEVQDHNIKHAFQEQVQLFSKDQMHEMLKAHHLIPIATFGDYFLNPFEPTQSDRLIIIAKR